MDFLIGLGVIGLYVSVAYWAYRNMHKKDAEAKKRAAGNYPYHDGPFS